MDYIEVKFTCTPNTEIVNNVLSACIAEIGFESFVENEEGTTAYIQENLFDKEALNGVLSSLPINAEISYTYNTIESQNWNEE